MIPQEPLERLRKLAADTGVTRLDLDPLLDDLRVAAAFYTRLPVAQPTPVDGAALARAGWAAPLVGVLIGALGALAYWIAYRLNLPPLVAATLAVGATLLLTGCLHEDGLADTADPVLGDCAMLRFRLVDAMQFRGGPHACHEPVGPDVARIDGIDLDVVGVRPVGERFGGRKQRCIDRAADGKVAACRPAADASDDHHRTAALCELRPGGADQPHMTKELEGEAILPVRIAQREEVAAFRRACIGNDDVDTTEFGDRGRD